LSSAGADFPKISSAACIGVSWQRLESSASTASDED
jgi:hypothetical protein